MTKKRKTTRKKKVNEFRFHNITSAQQKRILQNKRVYGPAMDKKYRYYELANKKGHIRGVIRRAIDGSKVQYKRISAPKSGGYYLSQKRKTTSKRR